MLIRLYGEECLFGNIVRDWAPYRTKKSKWRQGKFIRLDIQNCFRKDEKQNRQINKYTWTYTELGKHWDMLPIPLKVKVLIIIPIGFSLKFEISIFLKKRYNCFFFFTLTCKTYIWGKVIRSYLKYDEIFAKCYRFRHRNKKRRSEVKPWTKLFTFHLELMTWWKVWINEFSP